MDGNTATASKDLIVKAHTLALNATATALTNNSAAQLNGGGSFNGLPLKDLKDDAGNSITAKIGNFTVTPLPPGTDLVLTKGTDDGTQTIEVKADGTFKTAGLKAGDQFNITLTLTDHNNDTVTVTLTVNVIA